MGWRHLARFSALGSAACLALAGCAPQLARLEAVHPDDRIYVDDQYAGTGITSLTAGGYGPNRSFRIRIERPSLETYSATISSKAEPAMIGLGALNTALGVYYFKDFLDSPRESVQANLNGGLSAFLLATGVLSFVYRFKFEDAYRVTGNDQVARPDPEAVPPAEVAGDKAIADPLQAARLIREESARKTSYRQLEATALDGLAALAPQRGAFVAALRPIDEQRPFQALRAAHHMLAGSRSTGELNRAAIEAMLRAIDDPFAVYGETSPVASGSQASLGAFTAYRDGTFSVVRVLKGSKAEQAGLEPGDRVVSVAGRAVQGLSVAAFNALLAGAEGSPLLLEVLRRGPRPIKVTMTREAPSYHAGRLEELPGNIGYLRLNVISQQSAMQFGGVLERFGDREGVVLDLRGTIGGSPLDVGRIVEGFVKKGIVTRLAGRGTASLKASGDQALPERVPVVVLIDGGTSGGAEAIAGSLQDAKRATLIGSTTFGSASLQSHFPLGPDRYLWLSTGESLTAGGRRFQGAGIRPDILVPAGIDGAGRERHVAAALDLLVDGLTPEDLARKYKE